MNIKNFFFKDAKYEITLIDKRNNKKYEMRATSKYWFADPFVVEENSSTFVFYEMFDREEKRGVIGVSSFVDGKFSKPRIIIDEGIHMSFPNVFKFNGEYYMIPETYQANEIRLYKAVEFPYKWEISKVLLDNIIACDTIIDWKNSKLITYLQDSTTFEVYDFDTTNLVVGDKIKAIDDAYRILRPAGQIIDYNEQTIRPAQVSTRYYGEGTMFYRVIDGTGYEEEIFNDKNFPYLQCILPYLQDEKYDGLHTLNQSENYTIIDLYYYYYSLNVFIHRVWWRIKRPFKKLFGAKKFK